MPIDIERRAEGIKSIIISEHIFIAKFINMSTLFDPLR